MLKYEVITQPHRSDRDAVALQISRISRLYTTKKIRGMVVKEPENNEGINYRVMFTPMSAYTSNVATAYCKCCLFTVILSKYTADPKTGAMDLPMAMEYEKIRRGGSWIDAFTVFFDVVDPCMMFDHSVKLELACSARLLPKLYISCLRTHDCFGLLAQLRSFCRDVLDVPEVLIEDYLQSKCQSMYNPHSNRPIGPEIRAYTREYEQKCFAVVNRWFKNMPIKVEQGERDPDDVKSIADQYMKKQPGILSLTDDTKAEYPMATVADFMTQGWTKAQLVDGSMATVGPNEERRKFILQYVKGLKWGERRKALLDYAKEYHDDDLLNILLPYNLADL
jgi:hypothetical protein